jgi:hypothetical protein
MLHAQKTALQNTMRQRMVEIRERELDYYTDCVRNLGNQACARLVVVYVITLIAHHCVARCCFARV